jgi:hypothetical protein
VAFLDKWEPTKPQETFLKLPWTIKEGFFGGGVGGGKSDLLLVYPVARGLHKNPRFKQLFTRRTYRELKLEIVPRSYELYRHFGATFNGTDMCWTFPRDDQYGSGMRNDGARIFMGHIEHEKDVHQYDSMEINLWTPDELQSYTEFMYLYIGLTRVRTSDPSLPAIIRASGMPGGEGHTFVKKRFVDPCPEGGSIIKGKAGIKRFYVHATLMDNPHIDPEYKNSIMALPEAERKAKLGDWNAFQGQVFEEFREQPYPNEPENARHVIPPFEIPDWWPRIMVGDWGFAALTWIGFAAISPSKRVYIYRELAYRRTKISMWAPEVKYFLDRENIKLVKFCKSAGQDRGQEHTIQQQLEEALGRPIELTANSRGSRVAGKMMIHEFLRWTDKPKTPEDEIPPYDEATALKIYRRNGQAAYEEYLKLYEPPKIEVEIIPRLQIFGPSEHNKSDGCPILIEAIKTCVYDDNNVEDIAEFDGDDPIDGLRYICDAADAFIRESQTTFEKIQKQEVLTKLLENTQDWTAFYHQMRILEPRKKANPAISRYKRRRH